jgi:hypothetical protein
VSKAVIFRLEKLLAGMNSLPKTDIQNQKPSKTRRLTLDCPERNTDRNEQRITSMIHSFVVLLLASDEVNDYDDHAITFGQTYRFGVRDGVPYNTFLDSRA